MSVRTKHEDNRQRFILPPSSPFRRKRIPIACALLPAASIVTYLAYSALDYLSGGHAELTAASSGLVLHTVWRYAVRLAPSEDKLGGAWEDLKFRYGPLAMVCMCLFFRVGSAVFGVCSGPFIDFSSLSLVVVATSSVSLAVYSQYVGPLSFVRCSFTPLYDYYIRLQGSDTNAFQTQSNIASRLFFFISSLLPVWDKSDEIKRKRTNMLRSFVSEGESLFHKPALNQHCELSEPTNINRHEGFSQKILLRPKRSSSTPLSQVVISTVFHALCGSIFGFCISKRCIPVSFGKSGSIVMLIWIISAALSCALVNFEKKVKSEFPLISIYQTKDEMGTFVRNRICKDIFVKVGPYIAVFQILINLCFISKLIEHCGDSGYGALVVTSRLLFCACGGGIISLLLIVLFCILDCVVSHFSLFGICLKSLATDIGAKYTVVPVLVALCFEHKELIDLFSLPLQGSRPGKRANDPFQRMASIDQEHEEMERSDKAIDQICGHLLAPHLHHAAFDDISTFPDEICRTVVLESLGGGTISKKLFNVSKKSSYVKEISTIVNYDVAFSVPVVRALISFMGAQGECLISVYSKESPTRSCAEEVVCSLASSTILQTQFVLVAATRFVVYAFETKGRHHPICWLQNSLLDSIFRLRRGIGLYAAKRSLSDMHLSDCTDEQIRESIRKCCPEVDDLFSLCDESARVICNCEQSNNIHKIRVNPQCKNWLSKI